MKRYWQKVDEGKQGLFESAVARPVGGWLHPGVVKVQELGERNDLEDVHSRTKCETGRQQTLPLQVVVDQEILFVTFGQKDLDYWLQGSEEGGDRGTRSGGSTQEAKAAIVLPFVMNKKSVRDWYQSGGGS